MSDKTDREICEAATPGPWGKESDSEIETEDGDGIADAWRPRDTKFIAHFNPSKVAGLLADIDFMANETMDMENEINRLLDEIAQLKAENICDACGGTGEPISGRQCMCSGTGKMSDAVPYLRDELHKSWKENEALKAEQDEVRQWIEKALGVLKRIENGTECIDDVTALINDQQPKEQGQ